MREAKVTRKDKKAKFKKLKKEYEWSNYICFFPREFKADWKKKKKFPCSPFLFPDMKIFTRTTFCFKKGEKKTNN